MEIGDLVQYQNQRWLVVSYDRVSRLMLLNNLQGEKLELPNDSELTGTVQILANPSAKWPLVNFPLKRNAGPIVKILDPKPSNVPSLELVPWLHWIPSDPYRNGGGVFIDPSLKLLPGTILIATYQNGSSVRVPITKNYGTIAKKKAIAKTKEPTVESQNRFTRVLKSD